MRFGRLTLFLMVLLALGLGPKARATSENEVREWTILVYAAGDEQEIQAGTRKMIQRLESVPGIGQSGKVSILVQHDDVGEDPNYRYDLEYSATPGANGKPNTPPVPETDIQKFDPDFHYQERDSSNPLTLKSFLKWGIESHPARHYGLIFSGHSWGDMGFAQDFHIPGKDIDHSSMIRIYELRRIMEELFREEKENVPQGIFDFYLVDGCINGQMEIATEIKDLFRYFLASPVETTFASLPFYQALPAFVETVNESRSLSQSESDEALETKFLKPLVELYVRSHARGGDAVAEEGEMDPVAAFVIRTSKLGSVLTALETMIQDLPQAAKDEWLNKSPSHIATDADLTLVRRSRPRIPEVEILDDMDTNADLHYLAEGFQTYSKLKAIQNPDDAATWKKLECSANKLEESLGYGTEDPAKFENQIARAGAKGAWAKIQIDEFVKPRNMAVCIALKSYTMMNFTNPKVLPNFLDSDGAVVDPFEMECDDAFADYLTNTPTPPTQDVPAVLTQPLKVDTLFNFKLAWKHGISAYVSEEPAATSGVGKRYLWIWFNAEEGRALERHAFLRMVGTSSVELHYIDGPAEGYLENLAGSENLLVGDIDQQSVPTYFVHPEFGSDGLYVAEAHTNGNQFKSGIGISIKTRKDADNDDNMGGRVPIEKIEGTPFSMTLEQYLTQLAAAGDENAQKVKSADFYHLFRLAETGWADFIFGADPASPATP